jgi:hypothetical protein
VHTTGRQQLAAVVPGLKTAGLGVSTSPGCGCLLSTNRCTAPSACLELRHCPLGTHHPPNTPWTGRASAPGGGRPLLLLLPLPLPATLAALTWGARPAAGSRAGPCALCGATNRQRCCVGCLSRRGTRAREGCWSPGRCAMLPAAPAAADQLSCLVHWAHHNWGRLRWRHVGRGAVSTDERRDSSHCCRATASEWVVPGDWRVPGWWVGTL